MKKTLVILSILLLSACSKAIFKDKWATEKAPEQFTTRFETSKGSFDIEVNRADSPLGVDRFYQLVKYGFLDNTLFYRVVPNFVVQFGVGDTVKTNYWKKKILVDEPVKAKNVKGALSFARSGKDSRGYDLYINLKDNPRLDTITVEKVKGYVPFGKVTRGMEVVESLYGGYGNKTMPVYDSLSVHKGALLKEFPLLDKINAVRILKEK